MADIFNRNSDTIITGTDDADSISNSYSASNVTIESYDGADTIDNSGDGVSIDAGAGNDSIYNYRGDRVTIDAGAGSDYISNGYYNGSIIDGGNSVVIYSGDGDDTIHNSGISNSSTINSGDGNDSIFNGNAMGIIDSGNGDDTIENSGHSSTIDAGTGDDSITNSGNGVLINSSDGTDTIRNYGTDVTINTGTGDDYIDFGANSSQILVYNEGDGNDTVSIASSSAQYTLQVDSSATPTSVTSGEDLVVKIGAGSVTFLGMGSGESLNIVDPAGNALSLATDGSEDGKTETDTGNTETDTGNTDTDTGSTDTDTGETNTETVAAEIVNVNLELAAGDIGVFYITDSTDADAAFAAGSFTVYNNHIYGIYSNAAETWDEANAYAKNLGGYLAVINSAAENTALYAFLTSSGYSSAYFGLTDAESEGNWRWVNGEEVSYTNWASGEPNGGEYENYGMFYDIYTDGQWNDGHFGEVNTFIVEWDSDATIVGSVNSGTDYTAQNDIGIAQNVTVTNGWDAAAINLDDTINAAVGGSSGSIVSATVDAGDGNDLINASVSTAYGILWATSTLKGGTGDDTINIVGRDTDGIHPSTILVDGGAGSDLISIYGGYAGIHGGTTRLSESEKSSVSIDGGEGNDQIFITGGNKGIDIANVKINGGAGDDLVSISGETVGISGWTEFGNSTVSIDGGAGADTIAVNSIDSLGGVTIVAGEGDLISVGSGEAVYYFDSTSGVTINGATFTASSVDTSVSLESNGAGISIKSEWSGTVAISGENSLSDITGSVVSGVGSYRIVDGKFFTASNVTVDLSTVSDGDTGVFVVNTAADETSETVAASAEIAAAIVAEKYTPAAGDTVEINGVSYTFNGENWTYETETTGTASAEIVAQIVSANYTPAAGDTAEFDGVSYTFDGENWTYVETTGDTSAETTATFIPVEGEFLSYNGHYYTVYSNVNTGWNDAKAYCENLGGHLVTITDEAEQAAVQGLLERVENPKNSYWLGGYREGDEEDKGWQWISGETIPADTDVSLEGAAYSHWGDGQPDGDGAALMVYYSTDNGWKFGDWNDFPASGANGQPFFGTENFGLICEWDSTDYETVGNVTADKVYAASDNEHSQTIIIPEKWNVTATDEKDSLEITGNSATVAGGGSIDRFSVGSGVTDVVFADFTTGEDNISFETHIQENSLRQSTIGGSLVLSSAVMNMNFQNTPALTDELADTNVDNGGVTNTISELIETTSINPDANMRMYLSHWNYGFDSPEYAAYLANAESKS